MSRQVQKMSKKVELRDPKRFNTNLNKMDISLSRQEPKRWASFDTSTFPVVKVYMKRNISSDEEFDNFLQDWENLYKRNQNFVLFFDTSDVGFVSMKYAFRMRGFIRRLKTQFPDLLDRSLIKVRSGWVRFLLKIIFSLEKPVADVYIHSGNEEMINYSIENHSETPKGVTRIKK